MENMPGSVINQPERLKRLESPFSLFLCGVAAGRCSSYLDSLATDATHVPRSCCCEQRSSFFFFFFTHFFSSPLHFSQPSFLLLFLLLLFLCSTRERERFAKRISIFKSGRRLESTTKAPMGEQGFILCLR